MMTQVLDKAKNVVESRKFPQDQKGLEGFVLVSANDLYDLHQELWELRLVQDTWKPNCRKTRLEVVGE